MRRRSSPGGASANAGSLLPALGGAIRASDASGGGGAAGGSTDSTAELDVALPAGAGLSGAAHSPQNFWPAITVLPQAGQTRGRGLAHSPQNFCPRGLAVPQAGH